MAFSAVLTLLIALLALLSWWRSYKQYRSLPPGPTPLPFLGTPKYMNVAAAPKNYLQLIHKYGSMFTIWKLSEPVVVLCGYDTVKDALVTRAEEFSSHPHIPIVDLLTQGYGIQGPRWRSLRRFTISSMRNFGMGKKRMASRIQQEAAHIAQAVAETGGKPFNPKMILSSAVVNIIFSMLIDKRFDLKDPKLHEMVTYISIFIRKTLSPFQMLCNTVPWLLKVPIIRRFVSKEYYLMKDIMKEYREEHRRTLNPEAPRDLIDSFLLKIKEVAHEEDPDFCDTSLLVVCVGLLSAGSDTTASTLKFSLVLLANYPDVQAKVQQEIDEVTKSLRCPEIEDKPHLPYTEAVIHEIQRVLDLTPTAPFHSVTDDVPFRGFTLPKGTIVIPYISSVLNDPSQWETPEVFNPSHFLDEDGRFRTRAAFMPFSAGKRVCPGENLVRMELFLILSALLQKFTFKIPPGTKQQDSSYLNENKHKIIASAQICAVPRTLPAM